MQRGLRMLQETVAVPLQSAAGSKTIPARGSNRWVKPQQDWRKLNSDGAVAASGSCHNDFDVVPTIVYSIVELLDRSWLVRIYRQDAAD
ncbi:hypothetical protein V6N12_035458 [Hibiscus sabdariffa]|uniref:Uncharacterized protein n=1 Tax=Hibiscus sabdariffa TaxID=183260 RepID=A0ABR2EMT8_9ROSI